MSDPANRDASQQAVRQSGEAYMNFTFMAVVAALGGLLFGYDTGVISGALPFLREDFNLGAWSESLVAAVTLAGATLGAMAGGNLADRFGRRLMILITSVLFIIGAVLSAFAGSVLVLTTGRLIVGLAIGVSSLITPLYLSEIAPASRRGAMVSMNQFFITLGILVAFLVDYAFSFSRAWPWMLGLGAVPGVILFLGMLALPESPRWLLKNGQVDQAANALRQLMGKEQAEGEFESLDHFMQTELTSERTANQVSIFNDRRYRLPLVIGVGLAVLQQVTGINTVIYFGPQIFSTAGIGDHSASILANVLIGVVNVGMTIVAMRLMDRAGRRSLLINGLLGMTIGLLLLAFGFWIGTSGPGGASAWIAIAALSIYIAAFAIGMGPVFWLIISEIFPLHARGRGMAVATVANWGSNAIVAYTFLPMLNSLGIIPTFLSFAFMSVVSIFFTIRFVPETTGQTLEDIERGMSAS
ncbi:sugar porter family MFS transporter [Granulibacter bethesdensis]|nr:sugar porter family MFS transporter [Granulibacter bethesdensis]